MAQGEVQALFRKFAAPLAGYAATSLPRKNLAELLARNLWTALTAGPEMEEETWERREASTFSAAQPTGALTIWRRRKARWGVGPCRGRTRSRQFLLGRCGGVGRFVKPAAPQRLPETQRRQGAGRLLFPTGTQNPAGGAFLERAFANAFGLGLWWDGRGVLGSGTTLAGWFFAAAFFQNSGVPCEVLGLYLGESNR
jgi:hypothetical protein